MRKEFTVDQNIIQHIIHAQAGTIGKAIIELIMNAIDAGADNVSVQVSETGFVCTDSGNGFQDKDEIEKFFGRFGTPHEEGDSTYGRFRLGRGQIMAFASTQWFSNSWKMSVDTFHSGFTYDLEPLSQEQPGCRIVGDWYELIQRSDVLRLIQELRSLVRYTPATITLNGDVINRDPSKEEWDLIDDYAYYRVRAEGSIAIYNQGVLVRNDSGGYWGFGGVVVSKKPIALNVSRTEILRNIDPVWKHIAKQLKSISTKVVPKKATRFTESYRESVTRMLLSGSPEHIDLYTSAPVITILPGKKHLSIYDFLHYVSTKYKGRPQNNRFTVLTDTNQIPLAESIAYTKTIMIVHPATLDRFGVADTGEFTVSLKEIFHSFSNSDLYQGAWKNRHVERLRNNFPKILPFNEVKSDFKVDYEILDERKFLDKETLRVWTALRWSLNEFVQVAFRLEKDENVKSSETSKEIPQVCLGKSTASAAWTDGQSFIAIDIEQVLLLKKYPIEYAGKIFSFVTHELAHEGESVDAGHDENFYLRYHDLSIDLAYARERLLKAFLYKYVQSLEHEKKQVKGELFNSMRLLERAAIGRLRVEISESLNATYLAIALLDPTLVLDTKGDTAP